MEIVDDILKEFPKLPTPQKATFLRQLLSTRINRRTKDLLLTLLAVGSQVRIK
jgi:hypothetical protein